MGEPGRTCPCTPRSLLVPAGGVTTLDPSQRVSAKELQAKDREWQRQRNGQPAQPKAASLPSSPGSSPSDTTLRAEDAPSESGAQAKKGLLSRSLFGRKNNKENNTTG